MAILALAFFSVDMVTIAWGRGWICHTNGTEESVLISEVSLYCTQELFLGKEKVSLLERCPHFRGVLREVSSFQGCL